MKYTLLRTFSKGFEMSFLVVLVLLLMQICTYGEEEAPKKEQQQLSPARLRAEGDAAFSDRQYTKALKYFSQLVEVEPGNSVNWHKRGMAHLVKNNHWAAVADWDQAISIDDNFKQAYLYRGKSYKKLGRCEKALTDFNKYKTLEPSDPKVDSLIHETSDCVSKYERALQYISSNDCQSAQPLIENLLSIAPNDATLNFAMANCHYSNNDFQSVLKYTSSILRTDSNNLNALLLRGDAYYSLGENDMALKHYKTGLQSDPDHKGLKTAFKKLRKIMKMMNAANEFIENKNWKDAFDKLTGLLEIDPSHHKLMADIFLKRCKAAMRGRVGTNEDRIKYCSEAVNQNNENAEAYYLRGRAYKENKDWDEAVSSFEAAVQRDRQNRDYNEELKSARFEKQKASRKDYYAILDIPQHGSERDIKKGFRKCGLAHHPDAVSGKNLDEEELKDHEAKFKDCVEAYEILGDPEKREKYDRGEDVLGQMQGGNRGQGQPFNFQGFPFNFANFQGGGGGGGGGGQRFTFRFGG